MIKTNPILIHIIKTYKVNELGGFSPICGSQPHCRTKNHFDLLPTRQDSNPDRAFQPDSNVGPPGTSLKLAKGCFLGVYSSISSMN